MDISHTYAEVYEILDILGKEYIKKIPNKLYKYIDDNRDKKIIIEYDINKKIAEQEISEDTKNIIAYLNIKYWCTEEEKEKLIKQYKINDNLYEENLKKKYNVDMFKNNKEQNNSNKEIQLIVYEEKLFKKILKFVKSFLDQIKKHN